MLKCCKMSTIIYLGRIGRANLIIDSSTYIIMAARRDIR